MIPSGNPMFWGSRNRLEALPGPKTAQKNENYGFIPPWGGCCLKISLNSIPCAARTAFLVAEERSKSPSLVLLFSISGSGGGGDFGTLPGQEICKRA